MFGFAGLLIVFAAVIGATGMAGVIAYLLYRIRRLEDQALAGGGGRDRLGSNDGFQEDLLRIQDEMAALSERLDFTENLLMGGDKTQDS